MPTLKFIVSLDPLEREGEPSGNSKKALLDAWAKEKGVQIYSLAEGNSAFWIFFGLITGNRADGI